MTTDPKPALDPSSETTRSNYRPVTEEELAEWAELNRDCGHDWQDIIARLIAAVRSARHAEESWHNQAYLMEGKANDTETQLREARAHSDFWTKELTKMCCDMERERDKAQANMVLWFDEAEKLKDKLAEIRAMWNEPENPKFDEAGFDGLDDETAMWMRRLHEVIGE